MADACAGPLAGAGSFRDMVKDKRDRRITLWALGIGAVAVGIYLTFLYLNMRG